MSEGPWDSLHVGGSGSFLRRSGLPGWGWRRVTVFLLVLALVGYGGAVDASKERSEQKSSLPPNEEISEETKVLAQEYVDALSEINSLARDYLAYFREVQSKDIYKYFDPLDQLYKRLHEGVYLTHLNQLKADITSLVKMLQEHEDEIKREDKKIYRLTLSLQEELNAISELMEQDIYRPLREDKVALKQLVQVLDSLQEEGDELYSSPSEAEEELSAQEESLREETADIVPPPVPPTPPKVRIKPRFRGVSAEREFADRLPIPSKKLTIVVTNPIGDLDVKGWDKKELTVQATIEVMAETRRLAREYIEEVELVVERNGREVSVDFSVPQLDDPNTQIVKSTMEVNVPKQNRLVCSSSFGDIVVRALDNGVTVTGSYGNVRVDDIVGETDVTNSYGGIEINRSEGDLKVSNKFSPIAITASRGRMDISNQFSSVDLEQTQGRTTIYNSGKINVSRHIGMIEIENRYGAVNVEKVKGDVAIANQYQEVAVEDILGEAKISNAYSPIEAINVTGRFTARNNYSRISGEELYGPLDIVSSFGPIEVELAEEIAGPSTIKASYGKIKVSLSPDSDVLVTAVAKGANIDSSFPSRVVDRGLEKKTEIRLGRATSNLKIYGEYSDIKIRKGR